MLDVNARSFRGRLCTYSQNGKSFNTPLIVTDKTENISLQTDKKRILKIFGDEIELDTKLKSSLNSSLSLSPRKHNKVLLLNLPISDFEIDDDVEIVILVNGYDLHNNARDLVENVIKIRSKIGYNRLFGIFGIADSSILSLLVYMGVDFFDTSYVSVAGKYGKKMISEGMIDVKEDVSTDNIKFLEIECEKISEFIRGGRLRELVDQRSFSSPFAVAALRIFDNVGFEYQKESIDNVGRRFYCNSVQALKRPDIVAYRNKILEEYEKPSHKRVLVLLPCSAKKPYHTSKTHKRFSSAIRSSNFDTVVHEVILTSPLGAVPRELDIFYPANSYDIPVTGEWNCEEKAFIRKLISHIASQKYDKVISHLGEDTELIRDIFDDIVETVVGDSTSPTSLTNLENALREATSEMEVGNYSEDRYETIKSILRFQIGRKATDVLIDEKTTIVGKFPYWKISREKTQLGMLSEERGMVSFTIDGAKLLYDAGYNIVKVTDFELKGNVFAVGVLEADPKIRIGDEAVVVRNEEVIGVGVAMMSGREMMDLQRGIAVKIRHKIK